MKAAEHLHVSHSAVHRYVRMLEDEIHDRVLTRAGKHVKLTETGRIVFGLARHINKDLASVRRQINELNQLNVGHLRIGTATNILVFFLQHVLERFQAEFPGVEIRLITETAEHLIQEIRNDTLDLGIIFVPTCLPKEERGLEYEPLYKEEFVFVVGKRHPLAKRKIVPLSRLLEYPFIVYMKTSHVRKMLEYRLAKAGLVPKISMELENEEAIEKMLQGGNRVALLSKRRATSDHIHCLLTKEEPMYCQVAMVFPQADYTPAVVKEFARMCRETAASRILSPG